MPRTILALRVSLDKDIHRDIEIAGDASLYRLAEVINKVFGFDFDHSFGFYDNLKDYHKSKTVFELFKDMGDPSVPHARSVKKSKVLDAFDADKKAFIFLFDYGDEWLFEVRRLSAAEREAPKSFWKMTASKGDAPAQYPEPEEDDDGRPFNEKYDVKKLGDLTVVTRKPKG